jgi:hypothetical protein
MNVSVANGSSSASLPLGKSTAARRPPVALAAIFVWFALQIVALLLAAFRVPFAARFPALAEQLAMHEMLIVQTIGSALLFPLLFRTPATAAVVVASTPLLMMMAGILAAPEFDVLVALCLYATLWVVALGLWSTTLRTPRSQMYGVATAAALVIGGATLAYVAREFGPPGISFDWSKHGHLGPLMGGVTLMESGVWTHRPWAFLAAMLFSGVTAALIGFWKRAPIARRGKT